MMQYENEVEEAKGLVLDGWFRNENILKAYITDRSVPLKDRMMVYLRTPPPFYHFSENHPSMRIFTKDYGLIEWDKDFGKRHGAAVDLRNICREFIMGSAESLPGSKWTDDMKFVFVLDCVNSGIHEFEYRDNQYL